MGESICQSAAWSNESCSWEGDADELTRVRFVPDQHRDTAEAAGTWAGVMRAIHVCPDCLAQMREHDAEWIEVDGDSARVEAIEAAAKAAAGWAGWEWSHDPGGVVTEGPGSVGDWRAWSRWETERAKELYDAADQEGALDELYGWEVPEDLAAEGDLTPEQWDRVSDKCDAIAEAEREYGEACEEDADEARELGTAAVAAAKRGDFRAALKAAEEAAKLESKYGDAPSYSGLVAACKAALESS